MSLTERTAISEYNLAGQPIRAGQVAALTSPPGQDPRRGRLRRPDRRGERLVSTSGLPALQEAPGRQEAEGYAAAVATARRQAEVDLAAINRSVEEARAAASAEATTLEQGLVSRRQAAADEIAQIEARVQAARDAEAAKANTGAATTSEASGATSAATTGDTAGASTPRKAR